LIAEEQIWFGDFKALPDRFEELLYLPVVFVNHLDINGVGNYLIVNLALQFQ
jgi:hypothetical protein